MKLKHSHLIIIALLYSASPQLSALNIQLDYSYDSLGFFSGTNMFRRDIMEAAANVFEDRITDQLTGISDFNDGFNNFDFMPTLERPDTGATVNGPSTINPDTVIVYVGGTNLLAPTTLGEAGPNGFSISVSGAGPAAWDPWIDNVFSRGQGDGTREATDGATAIDTSLWGGTISFNNSANWYFDTDPSTDEAFSGNDFYSVALHEMAHVLGFGTADAFFNLVDFNSATFTGANTVASHGGPVSINGTFHFANGTLSTVNGNSQEAALDPDLTQGTRKRLTELDWAVLEDIGWELADAPAPPVETTTVPTVAPLHLLALFSFATICGLRSRQS